MAEDADDFTLYPQQRLGECGVSLDTARQVLARTPFAYSHDGRNKTGYYDPSSKLFIAKNHRWKHQYGDDQHREGLHCTSSGRRSKMTDLRVTLDAKADAAYVYLCDPQVRPRAARSYPCDPVEAGMVNLDFDDEGRLLGVEVLGAGSKLSRHLLDTAERLDT